MKYPILLASIPGLPSLASSVAFAQAVLTTQPGTNQTPTPAEEKPTSGDGKSPDDWRFAATLYGWAVNLNGSATARGNTVNINASIFDLLQKSNSLLGFMGDFEADKGPFGFFVDVVWAQLCIWRPVLIEIRRTAWGLAGILAGETGTLRQLIRTIVVVEFVPSSWLRAAVRPPCLKRIAGPGVPPALVVTSDPARVAVCVWPPPECVRSHWAAYRADRRRPQR
jgi:hypothetical protein